MAVKEVAFFAVARFAPVRFAAVRLAVVRFAEVRLRRLVVFVVVPKRDVVRRLAALPRRFVRLAVVERFVDVRRDALCVLALLVVFLRLVLDLRLEAFEKVGMILNSWKRGRRDGNDPFDAGSPTPPDLRIGSPASPAQCGDNPRARCPSEHRDARVRTLHHFPGVPPLMHTFALPHAAFAP